MYQVKNLLHVKQLYKYCFMHRFHTQRTTRLCQALHCAQSESIGSILFSVSRSLFSKPFPSYQHNKTRVNLMSSLDYGLRIPQDNLQFNNSETTYILR